MNEPTNCPFCKVSLLGDPIPESQRQHFSGTHWKREIAIVLSDRVKCYRCPDCGNEWRPKLT